MDEQLSREQRNLLDLISKLEAGLGQAKLCYGQLQRTLLELEEEISKKCNSVFIDEVNWKNLHPPIKIKKQVQKYRIDAYS